MMWTLVQKSVSSLDQRFEDAQDKLLESLYGTKKVLLPVRSCTPRWQTCIGNTDDTLGFALGALFVKATFDKHSKDTLVLDLLVLGQRVRDQLQAEEMINEIRSAFKETLDGITWMDEHTRRAAKDKADAIYDMIGFPEFILDPKELDDVFDGVSGGTRGHGDTGVSRPGDRRLTAWRQASHGLETGVSRPGDRRLVAGRRASHVPTCLSLQYDVADDSFFQNMLNFYNFSSRVMADQLRKTPNKDQ
ncbi:Endothelin-converting enzyme 2 [Liparis tanakae]|uniref:endothelin-converting enzyme 1 n=1 Tax=Liparis tanakae TaxID=230148 RepID=A0A4Z2E0M5_9TELE|nr:Endothelin-converting enzyme 2 [Liparis tanakae]